MLHIDMVLWSPILAGMATLNEMRDGTYDMDDLADMLQALSVKNLIESRSYNKSK